MTAGVNTNVSLPLQLFLWQCINDLKEPKDYLQVFKCSGYDGKQKIEHVQEEPEYYKEYQYFTDTLFVGKIFVIDDGEHSTMMLAEEY